MIGIAIAAFIATNIDDLFLLAAWFVRRVPLSSIFLGQFIGFSLLVSLCVGAMLIGTNIPHGVIRWLGILPVAIGVKELLSSRNNARDSGSSWLSVATVTVANGADNIGVYVPLFLRNRAAVLQIIGIFYAGLLLWLILAKLFERTLAKSAPMHRLAHRIAPIVVILIGVQILLS